MQCMIVHGYRMNETKALVILEVCLLIFIYRVKGNSKEKVDPGLEKKKKLILCVDEIRNWGMAKR